MKLSESMHFAVYRRPLNQEPDKKKTVCMDFDGCLSDSSGPYTRGHFGEPIEEGLHLLTLLQQDGYNVVILTARNETDLVSLWLKDHGFPGLLVTNHKVPALFYFDDRALRAEDNFKAEDVLKEIKRREHSNSEV